MKIQVYADADAVALEAAKLIAEEARDAVANRGKSSKNCKLRRLFCLWANLENLSPLSCLNPLRRCPEVPRKLKLDHSGYGNLLGPGSRILIIFKIPRPRGHPRNRWIGRDEAITPEPRKRNN